jgi:hypothetical protein
MTPALSEDNVKPSFDHIALGPAVEVRIMHGLGLELDALHQHYAIDGLVIDAQTGFLGRYDQHLSYWDFPLLLTWTQKQHVFLPISIRGGLSTRRTTGSEVNIVESSFDVHQIGITRQSPSTFLNTWTHGIVLGAGTSYSIGPLHLSPELRYTHWTSHAVFNPQANTNQLDVLLGLTFGTMVERHVQ